MIDRKKVYLFAVDGRHEIIPESELERILIEKVPDLDFNETILTFNEILIEQILNEKHERLDLILNIDLEIKKGFITKTKTIVEDLLGIEQPKKDYRYLDDMLNNLVEGSGPIIDKFYDDGIDLHDGSRILISKGKYEKPFGTEGHFSLVRYSKHDVWVYKIARYYENKSWTVELDINRQTHEADKLDLFKMLKSIYRTTSKKIEFGDGKKLSGLEAWGHNYEGQYLATEKTLEYGILIIEGVLTRNIENKQEAIEKIRDLYKKMIDSAVEGIGFAGDLLKKAGQCIRALYHLGVKDLPVEIQETKSESLKPYDGIELYFKEGKKEYGVVNLSKPDLDRLRPKSILFIPLEKIPGYDKMFGGSVEHKAYVVDLKFS